MNSLDLEISRRISTHTSMIHSSVIDNWQYIKNTRLYELYKLEIAIEGVETTAHEEFNKSFIGKVVRYLLKRSYK